MSYSADDIGKPGALPDLTDSQTAIVRRIQKYVHGKTLRFAFLRTRDPFVVFDATSGPCADFAPGYWVMNAPEPDTFFEPGEAPSFESMLPGEVAPTAGPWMRPVVLVASSKHAVFAAPSTGTIVLDEIYSESRDPAFSKWLTLQLGANARASTCSNVSSTRA